MRFNITEAVSCRGIIKIKVFFADADANGDISGDDQSINSDHHEANDENSMDSERGGALNLVSSVKFMFINDSKKISQ